MSTAPSVHGFNHERSQCVRKLCVRSVFMSLSMCAVDYCLYHALLITFRLLHLLFLNIEMK